MGKVVVRMAMGLLALALADGAAAQAFPSRPITVIYPYTAGASADQLLRVQVVEVAKTLGQSVVVDYRPGANGRLGPQALQASRGQGYLLSLIADSTLVIEPLRDPTYILQPGKDYTPILAGYLGAYILTVHPSVPARDIPALLAYAKANAGKLNFGVAQIGASGHMGMVLMNEQYGTGLTAVYYKGEGQLVPAVLGGEVQIALLAPVWKSHMDAGRLVGLAATTANRMAQFPNIPTVKEAGLPALTNWGFWVGLIGPADLPKDVTVKLNRAFGDAQKTPELAKRISDSNLEVLGGTSEDFEALIRARTQALAPLIAKVKTN